MIDKDGPMLKDDAMSGRGARAKLSVIISVYNSEPTLRKLVDEVVATLSPRLGDLEIILVNDGSTDGSHSEARAAAERHPGTVLYIRLARNFGEHNAVMCGLNYATGDSIAIIDDDLQNPPEEILRLLEKLGEGYDVVFGQYEAKQHSRLRNLGSAFNDYMATLLLGKPRGLYLSSFKVMNAFLAKTVISYRGPFPYLDGLILRSTASIGRQTCRHAPRAAGRSNYTFGRLVLLWLNMFTGFSVVPLRAASILGLAMATAGLFMAAFFIISWATGGIFFRHPIPPGWASMIVSVTFLAGIQLAVLGILGEYLGRLFLTQNQTPQYVVRERFEAARPPDPADPPASPELPPR